MRKYEEMYKSMKYNQTSDYYEARRHIQSAMEGDTPIKTGQNRQCIDNAKDYDKEYNRILNSVHHKLDLGPNMLLGAQQYTTVDSATALSIQEKFKGTNDENIHIENGQYRNEWYKRAENMVPQLDGTYNVSDDSNIDSHSYLDLASSNIIAHRTQGQKQRYETDIRAQTNKREFENNHCCMEVHNTSDSTVEFLYGQEMAYFNARSKGLVQINNSKHLPIDQYLHDRMTPVTLSPSPLAYEKPIHPTKMPCIATRTEIPIDDANKSTPDDKYPWLDPDDPRRNMTDKEIL